MLVDGIKGLVDWRTFGMQQGTHRTIKEQRPFLNPLAKFISIHLTYPSS
jgi:hypothetical protein